MAKKTYPLYIDGKWTPQTDGSVTGDMEPATGETLFDVHRAGRADVEKTLLSAHRAFETWSSSLASERERILLDAAAVMETQKADFMELLVREGGKPQVIAEGEFAGSVNAFRVAAGECRRHNTLYLPPEKKGQMSMVIRQPLGVVLGILPFNYPLILSVKKLVFAIAAGNTFILKPSPHTPAVCLLLGDVLTKAGLPAGVLNVLPLADEAFSEVMARDPRVRMISFTGGTTAGRKIATAAAADFKRVVLELGGKNPLVVLKDFDVDEAVHIAGQGAFSNQGQLCMATSRILVEKPLYRAFCDKITAWTKTLKTGNPVDPDVFIGPLINEHQCAVVQEQVDDAVSKGAQLLTGGTYDGRFYLPTVLCDVDASMRIFYEESFAPVTSIICVEDAEDALQKCNDNNYGLSAAVLTHNLDLAMKLGLSIEAGMVHVNDLTYLSATTAPSGGVKFSGIGREGGSFSMDAYTELKWLTFQSGTG